MARREFGGLDTIPDQAEWIDWFHAVGITPGDVTTTGFVEVKGNTVSYEVFVKRDGHFVRTADRMDVARAIRTVELDYTPRPFPGQPQLTSD